MRLGRRVRVGVVVMRVAVEVGCKSTKCRNGVRVDRREIGWQWELGILLSKLWRSRL